MLQTESRVTSKRRSRARDDVVDGDNEEDGDEAEKGEGEEEAEEEAERNVVFAR